MNLLEKLHQQIVQSNWAEKFEEDELKMEKEKLMQFLSDCIDKNMSISIVRTSTNATEEESKELAMRLSEIIGVPLRIAQGDKHEWFSVNGKKISGSFFHENSDKGSSHFMEEDVDLSGSAEIA